ncbi:hypothetical protein SLEP1_g10295 [Rubroshorea leprosula]|uniref:Uncharacterized protein n=1 Tax=Rubroshorea leprosula TaxID=152421 RepID=A0AAV5IDJ3_9ROSI|nr:hypothetical protein SLEP1_g10295 [Rubroshorea leprosula]
MASSLSNSFSDAEKELKAPPLADRKRRRGVILRGQRFRCKMIPIQVLGLGLQLSIRLGSSSEIKCNAASNALSFFSHWAPIAISNFLGN